MNTIHSIELIYSNPKIRGGRPCIVGTGLRVLDVVMSMHFGGRSPDQIASDYDISLAKVHAALAYYYENKAEIDDDIREDIRIGRQLAKEGFGKPENSIFPAPTAGLLRGYTDSDNPSVQGYASSGGPSVQQG